MKLDLTAEECMELYRHLDEMKRAQKYELEEECCHNLKGCGCGPKTPKVDHLGKVLGKLEGHILSTLAGVDRELTKIAAKREFEQWESIQKAKLAELEELEKHPEKKAEKLIESMRFEPNDPEHPDHDVFVRVDEGAPVKPKRKKK